MHLWMIEPGARNVIAPGAAVVAEVCRRAGHTVEWSHRDARQPDLFGDWQRPDAVLVSVYSPRQLPHIAKSLRMAGIGDDVLRIAGGQAATSRPDSIMPFVNVVVVGDSEDTLPKLLSQADPISWAKKDPSCFTGSELSLEPRWSRLAPTPVRCARRGAHWHIEMTRGCRYNCAFCQIGHIAPYRESSSGDIVAAVASCKAKKVNLLTSALSAHSDHRSIIMSMAKMGVALQNENSVPTDAKESKRSMTTGADAPSERIRRAVGKKVWRNSDIIKSASLGYSRFKLNMIVGYPGETDDDRREASKLLASVVEARGGLATTLYVALLIPYPWTAWNNDMSPCAEWDRSYKWVLKEQAKWVEVNKKRNRKNLRFFNPPSPERATTDVSLAYKGREICLLGVDSWRRTRSRYERRMRQ